MSGEDATFWRHKKTNHAYVIVGFCVIEATLEPAVIYRRHEETSMWVRPCAEFFDGRFRQEFWRDQRAGE